MPVSTALPSSIYGTTYNSTNIFGRLPVKLTRIGESRPRAKPCELPLQIFFLRVRGQLRFSLVLWYTPPPPGLLPSSSWQAIIYLTNHTSVCDTLHIMDGKQTKPKTLQDAIGYFADPENALAYMIRLRWPDGIVHCPECGRTDVVFLKNQRKWQCKSVPSQAAVFRQGWHRVRGFAYPAGQVAHCRLDALVTAATASALTRLHAPSALLRSRHGSCCIASGSDCPRMQEVRKENQDWRHSGNEVEVDETFVGGRQEEHAQG